MNRGPKNLMVLLASSIAIALTTTIVALSIYTASGDIYLDRSRPGFLPEEKEEPITGGFVFPSTGPLKEENILEFLEYFTEVLEAKEGYEFLPSPLSDESLGI